MVCPAEKKLLAITEDELGSMIEDPAVESWSHYLTICSQLFSIHATKAILICLIRIDLEPVGRSLINQVDLNVIHCDLFRPSN